jgi:hypothetical protein
LHQHPSARHIKRIHQHRLSSCVRLFCLSDLLCALGLCAAPHTRIL